MNPDFNSGDQAGTGLYQITARGRRRSSAAVAYLHGALRRRNLMLRTGARVSRILVEKGRAVGIEFVERGRTRVIRARKVVILSAGAVATPKLLMLSGIGPAAHFGHHGILTILDLPGVGQNLQDHIEISLVYQLNGPHGYDRYKKLRWRAMAGLDYLLYGGGHATSNLIEAGAFWSGDRRESLPGCQFFLVCGAGIEEGVDGVPGSNGCAVSLGQIRPHSRGEVLLASADAGDAPRVRPNSFGDPRDLDAVAEGTLFAMDVMEQPAIRRFIERRHIPEDRVLSRDEVRRFCQREAHAALHPSGTCRMGQDDMAVVDPSLRLRGLDGLRVADASIMPQLISGNRPNLRMVVDFWHCCASGDGPANVAVPPADLLYGVHVCDSMAFEAERGCEDVCHDGVPEWVAADGPVTGTRAAARSRPRYRARRRSTSWDWPRPGP